MVNEYHKKVALLLRKIVALCVKKPQYPTRRRLEALGSKSIPRPNSVLRRFSTNSRQSVFSSSFAELFCEGGSNSSIPCEEGSITSTDKVCADGRDGS